MCMNAAPWVDLNHSPSGWPKIGLALEDWARVACGRAAKRREGNDIGQAAADLADVEYGGGRRAAPRPSECRRQCAAALLLAGASWQQPCVVADCRMAFPECSRPECSSPLLVSPFRCCLAAARWVLAVLRRATGIATLRGGKMRRQPSEITHNADGGFAARRPLP